MILETERLILRPWKEEDAEELYEIAKDPLVGPPCGWNPHKDLEESKSVLKNILMVENTFCITLKETGTIIGLISLTLGAKNIDIPDTEGEIGFWMGSAYWHHGYMTEACREVMRYGFENLKLEKEWCCYFAGNDASKHVQERCGFQYVRTDKQIYHSILNQKLDHVINCITKEEYRQ